MSQIKWRYFKEAGPGTRDYWVTTEGSNESVVIVDGRKEDAEANARLIASAPDLLEALEVVLDRIGYTENNQDTDVYDISMSGIIVSQIQSAISKARGAK